MEKWRRSETEVTTSINSKWSRSEAEVKGHPLNLHGDTCAGHLLCLDVLGHILYRNGKANQFIPAAAAALA